MNRSKYESIFDDLSSLILVYESGDLVKISTISSLVDELSDLSPLPDVTGRYFSFLKTSCMEEFKGNNRNNFSSIISDGLDLLHSVFIEAPAALKKNTAVPEYLITALDLFLEKNAVFYDVSTNEPKQIGNENHKENNKNDFMIDKKNDHQKEIFLTFISDAKERLETAQQKVLDMETVSDKTEILNELFRVFHTFKGEAGFLGITDLAELTHNYENILDNLRKGIVLIDDDIIDLLLDGIDTSARIIHNLETENISKSDEGVIILINKISKIMKKNEDLQRSKKEESTETNSQKVLTDGKKDNFADLQEKGPLKHENAIEINKETNKESQTEIVENNTVSIQKKSTDDGSYVKIHSSSIQYLIDMLGELVISINQLDDNDRIVQSCRKIAKNLQMTAMKAGTVRIVSLFSNARRIVRDVSRQLTKDVELVLSGEDLEVDRKLVDKLGEPLMHLLRNAVGHGIETADERLKAGKASTGTVFLSAERIGHNVNIRVRDDGRGINPEIIKEKAVQKGFITAEKAATMRESEIRDLIFIPGFSSAAKVDAISGRGVGLDVVKTMIDQMRGTIALESVVGSFTEISLTFPINMAIIEGLIIRVDSRLLIIPVPLITEILELNPENFIEVSTGVKVCSLRNETMPVINLSDALSLKNSTHLEHNLAVVVETRGKKYALLVEEVIAKKEVVIKSLGRLFSKTKGISSGAILQGGRIGLVLDIDQIVRTE